MSTLLDTLIAGCAGGMAQVLAGQPFDMIKVRLQTSTSTQPTHITTHPTISHTLTKIIKNEGGLRALWKGYTSPLMSVGASVSIQFGVNEKTRNLVMKRKGINHLSSSQYFGCGVMAGLANSIVAIPSEHSRIRMQVQTSIQSRNQSIYTSSLDCIRKIMSQYGVKGLYKGGVPTVLREGIAFGIYFSFYEWLANKMVRPGQTRKDLSISKVVSAGSMTGVVVWLATFPIDVVKTKIQVDNFVNPRYNGMLDCIVKTYKADGVRGFYKGFSPCVLRAVPANGATFLAYEMTTQILNAAKGKNM